METTLAPAEYEIKKTDQKIRVNLWLDHYNNIFSDFDPRPYSLRELSDDFLNETKKIIKEVNGENMEVVFLVPQSQKNKTFEHIISSRLHHYFKKKASHQELEQTQYKRKGILLTFLGTLLMIGATISTSFEGNILNNFLRVILEPAGWFMTWYGLDQIFYNSKNEGNELLFNKKMAKAEIIFDVYSNHE